MTERWTINGYEITLRTTGDNGSRWTTGNYSGLQLRSVNYWIGLSLTLGTPPLLHQISYQSFYDAENVRRRGLRDGRARFLDKDSNVWKERRKSL